MVACNSLHWRRFPVRGEASRCRSPRRACLGGRTLSGARQPKIENGPIPGKGTHVKKVKNPLANGEIGIRAFSAPVLPPGDQAIGFFYFQTSYRLGAKVYITGIKESATGKELLYFEIPLSNDGSQ